MAVPGRRRSVPTDLIIAARDAPLPWGSGLGTLRVLPRKLRLNPAGVEPPGSDMFVGTRMDEWDRQLAAPPRQLATRPRVRSAYEYMSAWTYPLSPGVPPQLVLAHWHMLGRTHCHRGYLRHLCLHIVLFESPVCSVYSA